MATGRSSRGQIALAAMVAASAVFFSDLAYRAVVGRVLSSVARIPIDPAAMTRLPLQIGDWMGVDIPLDDAMKRATGVEAHINRQYSRANGTESVGLYVASGGQTRALVAHRPEVCYVASGWTLFDRRAMSFPLKNGQALPCTVFQFSRGGFDSERRVVLHYYIVDGEYCGDASLLRSRVWSGSNGVDYAAQVQIGTSISGIESDGSGMTLISTFAIDSALPIAEVFAHNGITASDGEAGQPHGEGE